jgi:hypothetical protein
MPPRAAPKWLGAPEPADGETKGTDKMHGGGPFYSHALCGGNVGLCKEREREVMAQRGGRASVLARAARRSSDVAVATALRGGHTEGVCPYTNGEEVSWTICRTVADAVCNIPTSNPYNHVLGMV